MGQPPHSTWSITHRGMFQRRLSDRLAGRSPRNGPGRGGGRGPGKTILVEAKTAGRRVQDCRTVGKRRTFPTARRWRLEWQTRSGRRLVQPAFHLRFGTCWKSRRLVQSSRESWASALATFCSSFGLLLALVKLEDDVRDVVKRGCD